MIWKQLADFTTKDPSSNRSGTSAREPGKSHYMVSRRVTDILSGWRGTTGTTTKISSAAAEPLMQVHPRAGFSTVASKPGLCLQCHC